MSSKKDRNFIDYWVFEKGCVITSDETKKVILRINGSSCAKLKLVEFSSEFYIRVCFKLIKGVFRVNYKIGNQGRKYLSLNHLCLGLYRETPWATISEIFIENEKIDQHHLHEIMLSHAKIII